MNPNGRGRLPSPAPLNATEAQLGVVGWRDQFKMLSEEWNPWLNQVSMYLAEGDQAFATELAQEGLLRLWRVDPARVGADNEKWLKQRMFLRMKKVATARLHNTHWA